MGILEWAYTTHSTVVLEHLPKSLRTHMDGIVGHVMNDTQLLLVYCTITQPSKCKLDTFILTDDQPVTK